MRKHIEANAIILKDIAPNRVAVHPRTVFVKEIDPSTVAYESVVFDQNTAAELDADAGLVSDEH